MSTSSHGRYEDVNEVLRYQMDERRLGRRGLLAAGGVLAAGGALNACTGGGGSYTEQKGRKGPEGTEAKIGKANIPTPREKTVIVGMSPDPTVFNRFNRLIPNGIVGGNGFDALVRESMFYLNLATGETIPWLATEYEYSADFKSLTVKLNPKAKWSDGKPLTSKDLRFSLLLRRDNTELLDGGGDYKDYVKDVKAVDAQTAVVELKKPNSRFHYNFIATIIGGHDILPEHIWKGKDPMKFDDNKPIRTGPYVLKEAVQSQKLFVWEKSPNYWNKDELDPVPQYVIYVKQPEQKDRGMAEFERAEFDAGALDEEHAKVLRSKGYKNLVSVGFNDPCPRGYIVNNDKARGIVADSRMRWVISYLTDRKKIGKTVWLVESDPAQYPWADYESNDKWVNNSIASKYKLEYDPKKAEKLLDQIAPKGGDGKRMYKGKPASLQIMTPSPPDGPEFAIAKLLEKELKQLGVDASARSLSGSVHDKQMQLGEYDISSLWMCEVRNDPMQLWSDLRSDRAKPVGKSAGQKNWSRTRDKTIDKVALALQDVDPESKEAKALLDQAMERYYQLLPRIPIIQTNYPSYFNTTFWKGWPTDDNLYQVPLSWWGHFMFVIGKLKPTGTKEPK